MDISTEVRSIVIDTSTIRIARYLTNIKNIVEWSSFFVKIIDLYSDGCARMQSKIGECTTEITSKELRNGTRITISSDFGVRAESATIDLLETDDSTELSFNMKIPRHVSSEAKEELLTNLEVELKNLKAYMEG